MIIKTVISLSICKGLPIWSLNKISMQSKIESTVSQYFNTCGVIESKFPNLELGTKENNNLLSCK